MRTKRERVGRVVILLTAVAFVIVAAITILGGQLAGNSHALVRSISIGSATTFDQPSGTYYDL